MEDTQPHQQSLNLCAKHLEEGDLLEAELVLDEYLQYPHPETTRPLAQFSYEAMEKLGVLFLTMSLPGTPANAVIWNELIARGMEPNEIMEQFELDSVPV
jgi:hypothetical protein